MERYVAVDNVCAWPNLTLLPDGAIVATIFNQPCHGKWEGDVECWASEDDGQTWQLRGTSAPHEPAENRMNVAAGLAHDEALIVLASGWSDRPPVGGTPPAGYSTVLDPWVCRSTDGGSTWERSSAIAPPPGWSRAIIPFGDIVRLSGKALGVSFYGWNPPDEHNAFFYRSDDDGQSWTLAGMIKEGFINETTLAARQDGSLLAAARTLEDQHLEIFRSTDEGKNWEGLGPATLGRQHPAQLLELADARVLLTYGIRNKGLYGVGARVSDDGGETWGPPRVLADLEGATDGGYPSSVQVADGAVVTAYYGNRTAYHHRYHMGVVRWQVDD